MSGVQASAREIRRRLRAPVNGHYSSELEIRSARQIRQDLHEQLRRERAEERAATINSARLEVRRRRFIERRQTRRELEAAEQAKIDQAIEFIPVIPKLSQIVDAVSLHYQISKVDILSHRRSQRIALCRHTLMYLARKLTMLSLAQIGRRVGGRDHTTVVHSVARMRERLLSDPTAKSDVETITHALGISDAPA